MSTLQKIVIATDGDAGLDAPVSGHFGRCPYFTFVTLQEDGSFGTVEVLPNPAAQNHQPGQIPQFVRDNGADVILCGGIGQRAISIFENVGVEVASGASGRAGDALQGWRDGLVSGVESCKESEEHHQGGHHHH